MVNELEHCMCWGFKNSYAYLMTWLNSTKSCYKLSWLTNLFTHRKLYTYFRPVPIIASKQKLCVRRNTPDNFWQYIHVCSSLLTFSYSVWYYIDSMGLFYTSTFYILCLITHRTTLVEYLSNCLWSVSVHDTLRTIQRYSPNKSDIFGVKKSLTILIFANSVSNPMRGSQYFTIYPGDCT